MSDINKPPKKSNFGAWVFVVILVLAMLLALGVYSFSNTAKNMQATMTAIARGTGAP